MLRGIELELIELQRVLENIIQFMALEKGTVSLMRRTVLPGPWLRQLIARWQPMQPDKTLAWNVEIPDTLPPIRVDEDKLAQSLNNLLANTVRRAHVGSTLSFAAKIEGEWLLVSVTGDQLALKREDFDRIFDLFYTGDAESRFPVSMGLGLYVARQLVRHEGGELEAILPASKNGSGGFAIRLPLAASTSADDGMNVSRSAALRHSRGSRPRAS